MTVHHQPPRIMGNHRTKPPAPRVKVRPVTGTRQMTRPFGVTGRRVPVKK